MSCGLWGKFPRMTPNQPNDMTTKFKSITAALLIVALAGCASMTTSQKIALSTKIAQQVVTVVADIYGQPLVGRLASEGLNALATVLQGYVGATAPASVVRAAPGVQGVAPVVLKTFRPDHVYTQEDVNTLFEAAQKSRRFGKVTTVDGAL